MARKKTAVKKTTTKTEWVRCAYCQSKGKDPFGIMSSLSTCGVCGGKGQVEVEVPYVTCVYCEGTGIQPRARLTCSACRGHGVIHVEKPTVACPTCGGLGIDPSGDLRLPCTTCEGAGVVTAV